MNGWKSTNANAYRVLSAAGCAALALLAWSAFSREYIFAVSSQGKDDDIALEMRSIDARWLTSSVVGASDLMKICANLLISNEMARTSSQLKAEIAGSCGVAAMAILRRSPSFARAHAVGLLAAGTVTPNAYSLAEMAAPFEPWPLAIRLLAAERAVLTDTGALPEPLAPRVAADVDRAMQSNWGRRFLAGLYVRQTGLRRWIQQIVSHRPQSEQADFLRALQSVAAANG